MTGFDCNGGILLNFDSERKWTETDMQAIFSTTVSAWQFESLMISEAAKMAQNMGYNKATGPNDSICYRTFWVIYSLEKTSCFITGRTSVRHHLLANTTKSLY